MDKTTLLGLVMIYSWVHAIYIVNKKNDDKFYKKTSYEELVTVIAITNTILCAVGLLLA